MFGSTILELAISLVFVYLVFSLVCSGIKEWLHYLLSIRSKTLEEAITKMLKSQALVKAVYSHHLVQEAAQAGIFKKAVTSPEKTLTKSVSTEGEEDEKAEKPVNIPNESFANALVESVVRLAQQKDTSEEAKKAFDDVKAGIAKIANNEARKILTELINKAQDTAAELKEEVDKTSKVMFAWFDNRMTKLSNWYRKKSRMLIFFLAVFFVAFFNVDTIMLIKTLSVNPELRAAIVSQAETLSSKSEAGNDTQAFFTELESLKAQVRATGLPLGWSGESKKGDIDDPRAFPVTFWGWVYKIIGLMISLMAVGMGAPFWFDILKWLIGLRKGKSAPPPDTASPNNTVTR